MGTLPQTSYNNPVWLISTLGVEACPGALSNHRRYVDPLWLKSQYCMLWPVRVIAGRICGAFVLLHLVCGLPTSQMCTGVVELLA